MMTDLFYAACGYVACVLFPMPGLSRLILDGWAKLGTKLTGKPAAITAPAATTPVATSAAVTSKL